MATPGPSPSKLVEDSDTAAFSPQPSGKQQALDVEDVIEFVEPLPDELQCPLCLEFLKEPTLTSCCGHHFCHECINRTITRSHVCPLCKNQGFQTFLNKEKQRVISTLKVYCRRKSRGCKWVGELGRLERHLDVEEGDCSCVEVECEFGPVGCVAKLPRKDLQRHKAENVHKHLVLMSESNEALVKELQEQRVEFQQQLKQKDEELQAIQKSLQQQVDVAQELRGQLQQQDQQIADIRDQLLQRGKQIAAVHQNMEAKQQMITNLERQLKEEAEQLARVEVELIRKNEKRLGDIERKQLEERQEVSREVAEVHKKVQEANTQSKANEKRLGEVEREQREEKLEINRRLDEVDKKVEEKGEELQKVRTQFEQGNDQIYEGMTHLRRRIAQVETSLAEVQDQVKEKVEEQLMTFFPPPVFTMTDFEQHKKDGDDWFSPPFYSHTGGYKMGLSVDANGHGSGKGTHVSVYVYMMYGEHDDHLKWPFSGDITVQLLNQRGEEKHRERTIHSDGTERKYRSRVTGRHDRAARGWGKSKFIAHTALGYDSTKNTEYLRNDCLKFEVTNVQVTNL